MGWIEEIARDVYRTTIFDQKRGLGFNQYLVLDDRPAMISTGSVAMFDEVVALHRKVMDPSGLRYLILPHFEHDEAGAMTRFMELAPGVEPVCGAICARQLLGFGLAEKVRIVKDGEVLPLGRRRLRLLYTPFEMHLWDGLVAFEESEGILFSSDLFGQWGETPDPAELPDKAVAMTRGAIPERDMLTRVIGRLASLPLRVIAPGHGAVIRQRIPECLRAAAG
ncbi:MAG: hypothetical protein HYV08_12425 [Deltaproteobacteria bacterium]|nr:hypothetical protein [Deltaproteobacteria bacterium]MBI3075462.1 hypothetical protein [Deltaproteobacteria bacterium]